MLQRRTCSGLFSPLEIKWQHSNKQGSELKKWWREIKDKETASRENLPLGNCIRGWGWALEGEGTSVEETEEGRREWIQIVRKVKKGRPGEETEIIFHNKKWGRRFRKHNVEITALNFNLWKTCGDLCVEENQKETRGRLQDIHLKETEDDCTFWVSFPSSSETIVQKLHNLLTVINCLL